MYDLRNTDEQLTAIWIGTVASRFRLDKDELTLLFDRQNDKHDSEMRTRELFKYSAHRGVSSTPTFILNGATIQGPPSTANSWVKLLQGVYDKQTQH